MVDRLEELLALMEEEDEENEREDAPAVGLGTAVPALAGPEIGAEKAPEDKEAEKTAALGGAEPAFPPDGTETVFAPDRAEAAFVLDGGEAAFASGGAEAASIPDRTEAAFALDGTEAALERTGPLEWRLETGAPQAEKQDEFPGTDGAAMPGAAEEAAAEGGPERFLWDELTTAVMGRNGSAALRRPGAGDVEMAELAGTAWKTAAAAEMNSAVDSLTAAERGLEELYRQTARAGRPPDQRLPVEQAGRSARAEEPGRTAALTVDELDRAVRRDSRRYDGGMMIF